METEKTSKISSPLEKTKTQKRDQGFLERLDCPTCQSKRAKVLKAAKYPSGLNRDQLLQIYCSSSDEKLMDQMVQCQDCDLVYLNPRVKETIGIASYSNAQDTTFVSQNEQRIATFSRSLKNVMKIAKITPSKDKKILDVGCAGGAFLKAATDMGFSGVGIEPSKWLCEWGKENYGLDLRPGILRADSFEANTFDMVTLWDVLEHVYHPVELLETCRKVLKPGGTLVVNYPDYASVARKLLGDRWPFFLSVHLYYFTPKTVRDILNKTQFEVNKIEPHWQTLTLSYVLKRATTYIKPLGIAKKMVDTLRLGNIPFTYQVGQTLVVATKPS